MSEKSLLPEELAEERERQSGEQFKKALIRQGRVENFFGIPDKEDMSRLEEYKTWAGNNAWMGNRPRNYALYNQLG